MRILNVIATVNPTSGGVLEWVKQYGDMAVSMGHTIEVATMDEPEADFLASFSLKTHAFGGTWKGFHSPRLLSWLKENASHYDCIISHGLWRFPSFGTWLALHNSQTPYFSYTHGMLDPWFKKKYPLKHLGKSIYWPWTDYKVLRDAKGVIFTCEEERSLAHQSFDRYQCNEVVLSLGISAPPDNVKEQKEKFFKHYPHLRGKKIFLFISRIHEKKGCDLLIEAFAEKVGSNPDFALIMAGPDQTGWGEQLKELARKRGVEDRITWTGMISGDVKWGAIRCAEAMILPSHQENFGFVVVEALACGVPAYISNKVNIYREIEFDGSGVVANDDLEGTRFLLNHLLSQSESDKSVMKQKALNSFNKRFEIKQATSNLLEYLASALQG